jgi:hypothetical protein
MRPKLNGGTLIFALAALIVGVGVCGASSITYDIDQTGIGPDSVTGTIETNGTIGVLTASDILDWDLQLFNGTNTFDLYGPLSGDNSNLFLSGNALTGSATQLQFDFSASIGEVLIEANSTGLPYWQLNAGASSDEAEVAAVYLYDLPESGTGVVGAVPEPSTWGLMLIGIAAMVLIRKRVVAPSR